MVCEKCGYKNSEYDIICEKCGCPLNIEKNIELQKKYRHKQRAIDIERITPDQYKIEFQNTKKKVRIALISITLLFIFFILIFTIIAVKDIKTNDILNKYDSFVESSDIGILYLGKDEQLNEILNSYASDYEFAYLYVPTNKVTAIKKNRIKSKLKLNKIDSTIVILEKGKVFDSINDCEIEDIAPFLQNNNILPKELDNPNKVISSFDTALVSQESRIIYIANTKNETSDKHNKQIKSFCNDYSINYTFIEGYYLTESQKLRLLRKLNYSEIHEEVIALIDEGAVKEVSEYVSGAKKDYFELANNYGIIDTSSAQSLKNINFSMVKTLIANKDKNIIILGSADCLYCERLKPIIGKIGIQNNLTIYYFEPLKDELSAVEEYLSLLGYKEGKISSPLILITENNQLLDYIIGLADKSLYEEKFVELGVIR